MERKTIPAIGEGEFMTLLREHGLEDAFLGNQLKCARCGRSISAETLLGYSPHDTGIKLYCIDVSCKRR